MVLGLHVVEEGCLTAPERDLSVYIKKEAKAFYSCKNEQSQCHDEWSVYDKHLCCVIVNNVMTKYS